MSCKYKYFIKSDPKKEAVGIVIAKNLIEAIKLAASKKKIDLISFGNIFEVQKL